MDQVVELPYGARTLELRLPEANLAGVFTPQPVEPCADLPSAVRRALEQPLDGPPLGELARPGESVVILLEDHTRPTPTADLLPHVLEALGRAGVRDADITLMLTHGTHRLSTEQEVERIVGAEPYRRLRIVQHRCDEPENQFYSGLTSRGTPVWVNRLVVEADRRIGIGYIGPSPYAGYSGGWKLIVPGVAALDTINANHSLVPLGFHPARLCGSADPAGHRGSGGHGRDGPGVGRRALPGRTGGPGLRRHAGHGLPCRAGAVAAGVRGPVPGRVGHRHRRGLSL